TWAGQHVEPDEPACRRHEEPPSGGSEGRRRPDSNRRWGFCRPLPCHLATPPGLSGASLGLYRIPKRRPLRCELYGRKQEKVEVGRPLRSEMVERCDDSFRLC